MFSFPIDYPYIPHAHSVHLALHCRVVVDRGDDVRVSPELDFNAHGYSLPLSHAPLPSSLYYPSFPLSSSPILPHSPGERSETWKMFGEIFPMVSLLIWEWTLRGRGCSWLAQVEHMFFILLIFNVLVTLLFILFSLLYPFSSLSPPALYPSIYLSLF